MEILIGLVAVVAAVATVWAGRRAGRDEVFAGLTPGLLPAPGQQVERRTDVAPAPVAVRFEPPAGLRPAATGVIADSRFDPVELSATLIDLAVRGWLVLRPVGGLAAADGRATPPQDWELARVDPAPTEPLSPTEQAVLEAAFAEGPVTSLAQVRAGQRLAATMSVLQADVGRYGWYRPAGWPALVRSLGWVGVLAGGWLLLGQGLLGGLGVVVAGAILLVGLRREGLPLTAEGSAARSQAWGFRQYLATAEAEQLRFEAGIDRFSRYLPWAMVFGVVDHWREVFADALRLDPDAAVDLPAFGWLAVDNVLTTVLLLDLLDGGLFDGLAADLGAFDGLDGGGLDGGGDLSGDTGDGGGFGDSGWGDGGGFDFGGGE